MTGSEETPTMDELTRMLEAEAPRPRPGFQAELRDRVDAGFPRKRRLALPRPSLPPRKVLVPAFGGLAAVVIAVSIAVSTRPGRDTSTASSTGASALSQRQAPGTADGAAGSSAGAPAVAPADRGRRIKRAARLTIAAPGQRLQRVGDRIVGITDRYHGFVLSSSLSSGRDASQGGSYELRVPVADLRPVLRDLSRLGTVRSQSQTGEDVTSGYASAADRLQSARAERRGLLRRLERAQSATAADALRRQLDLNAGQVSSLRAELKGLRERTDYANISVTLEAKRDGGAASPGGPRSGIGRALDDAVGSLSGSVELLIRVAGVAIPVGVIGALAWFGAVAMRRRRRESALS